MFAPARRLDQARPTIAAGTGVNAALGLMNYHRINLGFRRA
jgi:hypothetical protein